MLMTHGIPCYVEKPVVASWDQLTDVETVLRALPGRPVTLTGCNLRLLPSLDRLRDLLRDGCIGRPVRASLQVGQWLPDWRPGQDYRQSYSAESAQGGGAVLDLIHELDMVRWLFGDFEQVRALGGHHSRLEIRSEDCVVIALDRPGGPVVSVGMDYVARRAVRRYEIIGEEGTLVWDLSARRLELQTAGTVEEIDCGAAAFDIAATYPLTMQMFSEAVVSGESLEQDIQEGLRSARLALRVKDELSTLYKN